MAKQQDRNGPRRCRTGSRQSRDQQRARVAKACVRGKESEEGMTRKAQGGENGKAGAALKHFTWDREFDGQPVRIR